MKSLSSILLQGRVGLGREDFVREKKVQKRLEAVQSVTVFRQQKQKLFSQKRVAMDLHRSQLACKQLDSKMVHYFYSPFGCGLTPFSVWFRVFSLLRKNGSGPWILRRLAAVNLKVKRNVRKLHWRYFTLSTLEEGRRVPNWF